jgi:RNA polymerase sigma factor (sigma-70 family)
VGLDPANWRQDDLFAPPDGYLLGKGRTVGQWSEMNHGSRGTPLSPVDIFAHRYREYLSRVLNYVRLRVQDEALAQDLTAVTFERALSRLHTLRDDAAFGGWLFAIARNAIAEHYRRRQPVVPLERVQDYPASDPSVEGQVLHTEELDQMRAALALLSEREQEIIRLKFVAGLTNRAIAEVTRLREGNVAVILYRVLRKLRRTMEGWSQVGDEVDG